MTDRLDALAAFVAVCDAPGFAAAARRLNVSPSVVTRLVAGLEQRLGVRLLQRTTRSVRVTDAGARFLERARRVLSEMDEAERSALDEHAEPRGRLVVGAPLLFGRIHVAPIVARFLATHRQANADLQLSDRVSNLIEDGVDVAIRIGKLADSGLIARRLGQTRRVLVAAPGYLDAHGGAPAHPNQLTAHRIIAFRAASAARTWALRAPDGAALTVEIDPHFATNSGGAAIDYAVAGGGIVSVFCYQVEAALRSGGLVEVLAEFSPPPAPIHAVFPTARLLSNKVRAFLDLAERAAATWRFPGMVATPRRGATTG
jgi:DNA-binding transcriptional LysR family regulator